MSDAVKLSPELLDQLGQITSPTVSNAISTLGVRDNPEEIVEPLEENGFTLLDFEREGIRVSQFRWTTAQGLDAIARLEPFVVHEIPRASPG